MNSSTSSSEPPASWRRFFQAIIAWALVLGGLIYGFVAVVDPWDNLPLSPPFDRTPVSTNARWSFPALARSPSFDSMILGSSTTRLMQPAVLDPLFGARFVNLSMNDATAYEQWRIGTLFLRHHPGAKFVLIGLDAHWCLDAGHFKKYTFRPFPEWMYGNNRWIGYAKIFDLYAVEQAGLQFSVLTGLMPERYGRDGYTDFLPSDGDYDLAKVRAGLPKDGGAYEWLEATRAPEQAPPGAVPVFPEAPVFPEHEFLADLLAAAPDAEKIVFFVPYNISAQPQTGAAAAYVEACKASVAAITAQAPRTRLIDYMIPGPLTRADSNYWDYAHFRVQVALWLMRDLRAALDGLPRREENGVILR